MKKFTLKNLGKTVLALALALLAFGLLSCKKEKTEVQTVIVGTGSDMQLYCYLDEKGELAGYEIDVMKAIDELLPQYKFEFQTFDFKNILLALSAGKVDIGAHAYESNPERRKNYLFTEYGYNDFSKYIVVLKENTDVHSLKDLVG
ncbi:MAG: transporter substrate-binding domain-containing protein, partial [Treponema sp.]|nr:transporter substrate-binding domain-containing protein [Treponema sp.]